MSYISFTLEIQIAIKFQYDLNINCNQNKGEEPTFLKPYVPGEAFGELALLYNAPRAASIIAKSDCILYSLDRETFNNIVKNSAM